MYVYLQHDREKPLKIEVKNQAKASKYLKKGSVTIKGKEFRVLGEEFSTMIDVFYSPTNSEVWTNYKILKDKVKHFKKTGIWLKD